MNKNFLWLIFTIFGALSCLGSGLHYFISGESVHNSYLRNYAVAGQIIFAFTVIGFGVWYYKNSHSKSGQ